MPAEEIDPAKWRIYRLEFIFLNPEEYRWQVFQYWPGPNGGEPSPPRRPGEAVYRTQAQQLLRWVYEAAKGGFADPKPIPEVKIDAVSIWNKMLERVPEGPQTERIKVLKERLSDSCRRVSDICQKEGIPKQKKIMQIMKSIGPKGKTFDLGAQEALDLVSALYVAHDWDVWGRFAFPGEDKKGAGAKQPINPARLGSFSYVIDYSKKEAANLLGYQVDLLCAAGTRLPPKNKAARTSKDRTAIRNSRAKFGGLAEYGDYFDHCNGIKKLHAESYRLYGYLIDEIAQEVADQTTIFFRCFPLRICGYDHFIQVLLKPTNKTSIQETGIDLPKVFSNPGRGARRGTLPSLLVLKECLREMIVQMHIAAFKRAVIDELDQRKHTQPLDLAYSREVFAKHAPNLVRMDRVWVNGHAYAYTATDEMRFKKWDVIQEGDEHFWEDFPDSDEDKRFLRMDCDIKAHIPWEEDFKSLSALLGGTGKMRLEEQWDWLKLTVERRRSVSKIEKVTERENERAKRSERL